MSRLEVKSFSIKGNTKEAKQQLNRENYFLFSQ